MWLHIEYRRLNGFQHLKYCLVFINTWHNFPEAFRFFFLAPPHFTTALDLSLALALPSINLWRAQGTPFVDPGWASAAAAWLPSSAQEVPPPFPHNHSWEFCSLFFFSVNRLSRWFLSLFSFDQCTLERKSQGCIMGKNVYFGVLISGLNFSSAPLCIISGQVSMVNEGNNTLTHRALPRIKWDACGHLANSTWHIVRYLK